MEASPAPIQAEPTVAADADDRSPQLAWLVRASGVVGGALGAWMGYGFGHEVSGVLLGLVAGANCAVFGVLLSGGLAESMVSRWGQARRSDT